MWVRACVCFTFIFLISCGKWISKWLINFPWKKKFHQLRHSNKQNKIPFVTMAFASKQYKLYSKKTNSVQPMVSWHHHTMAKYVNANYCNESNNLFKWTHCPYIHLCEKREEKTNWKCGCGGLVIMPAHHNQAVSWEWWFRAMIYHWNAYSIDTDCVCAK